MCVCGASEMDAQVPPDDPFARVVARAADVWPDDVVVTFMLSSGGVPPAVVQWRVDARGVGEARRILHQAGKPPEETWPVRVEVADLKALVRALAAVDFEHARRPIVDSPAQFVGVSVGGRSDLVDIYGLSLPGTAPGVLEPLDRALGVVNQQVHRPR